MYLVDPHTPKEGLGDCLCSLHNSIANTNYNDTIYIQKSKHAEFHNKIIYPRTQIKDIYKRNFVYVKTLPTPYIDVSVPSKELLTIFNGKSNERIIFPGYPKQQLDPPYITKLETAKGQRRKKITQHCIKRTFKKDWEEFVLPFVIDKGYDFISYYETDIEKIFDLVSNAKIVIGAEGGIYHLSVFFGKPYIWILPDVVYNSTGKFRKACLQHAMNRHPTYNHKFIQESRFEQEVLDYL